KIQDAQQKIEAFRDCPGIHWHLIGHVQSNKAKLAIQLFDWIHSVDSLKLAKRLNRLAQEDQKIPKVCLQVKVRPDPDKYGWDTRQLLSDLPELEALNQIHIQGLMAILPRGLTESEILSAFQDVQSLATQITYDPQNSLTLPELSMGMSQDYLLAIKAGATMIRLGRILFPSL
ncbi:MAG: YggS family pyridoxal phosphate-dependent enzyme, partial [Acaryochloridaceae cyanobacterium RL_2_7]|nr:YggS family pyridoxal phosphate-dependent enzyme [Acaryochloridaceae cyanobacterium RL_2_7]